MLSIITVVYKNYEVLHDFIQSLTLQTSHLYHLYIVDVTPEQERSLIPWIRKIEGNVHYLTAENKGYAHAVNVGIAKAKSDGFTRYAVVNSDIVFDTHFVLNASHAIAHHPRSIIGGKIYYAPGYEFHTKSKPQTQIPYTQDQTPFTFWYAGGTILWDHATTVHRGVDEPDAGQFNALESTDTVTGCLMLYDKTVADIVGTWDEGYFMYYEDTDYCVRATRKKLKVLYDPSVVIWHKNAQSTGGSGSLFHSQAMKSAYLRFALKYAPLRTKIHVILNHLRGTS